MSRTRLPLVAALLALAAGAVHAAGGDVGEAAKQATNWIAIIMFTVFVVATLGITKWAAGRTKSAADFYTPAAASPAFRTGWPSRATTCRRRPSSASRRPSWPAVTTA